MMNNEARELFNIKFDCIVMNLILLLERSSIIIIPIVVEISYTLLERDEALGYL